MPSTIKSGVITLVHTACGAGILAMPYAFKPFGLILGILMIVSCWLFASFGLFLQAYSSQYAPPKQASFFFLSQITYPQLSVIFDFAIAAKCFGVGVSYMVVVGDLMPQIFSTFTNNSFLLLRNLHITLIMLLIVSPLCFMKKLNSLRYASMIAISAVAYLCILVVVHFLFPNKEIENLAGEVNIWKPKHSETSLLATFPIFVFAYTCHHNMFSIINELYDNSIGNLKILITSAMSLALILYITIGSSGYLTFGDNISGNIITMYPPSIFSTIGRVAIVILVVLAFPLQCHPARASINHILYHLFPDTLENKISENSRLMNSQEEDLQGLCLNELSDGESNNNIELAPLKNRKFIIITTVILVSSYVLAVSVTSLAKVLAIVGATGSTSISFILPGIFGFHLIGSEFTQSIPWKLKLLKYMSLLLSICGIVIMITCLGASIFLNSTH